MIRLRWWWVTPLSLLVALWGAMLVVIATDRGTQWVLQYVSDRTGAPLQYLDGNLATRVSVAIRYDVEPDVSLPRATLDVSLTCLLVGRLCFDLIVVDELQLTLAGDDAREPGPLPVVAMPLELSIDDVSIGVLRINGPDEEVYRASDLRLQNLVWENTRLSFQQITLQDDYCGWQAENGELNLEKDYPLALSLQCEIDGLLAKGDVKGSLDNNVEAQITLQLAPPLVASAVQLQGELNAQPLADLQPFNATVTGLPFVWVDGDSQWRVTAAVLSFAGDRSEVSAQINALIESPYWTDGSPFQLQATVFPDRLNVASAQLGIGDGRIDLQGELTWQQALSWQGGLGWQNIDLSKLRDDLPGVINGEVKTQFNYSAADDYRGELAIEQFSGSWFNYDLTAVGDIIVAPERVRINRLALSQRRNNKVINSSVLNGEIENEKINLRADVDLNDLSVIAPDLTGKILADVNIVGTVAEPTLSGSLAISSLAYQELFVDTVQWQLSALSRSRGSSELSINKLRWQDQVVDKIKFDFDGGFESHRFALSATGVSFPQLEPTGLADNSVTLSCGGSLSSEQSWAARVWRGGCDNIIFSHLLAQRRERWQLENPIPVSVTVDRINAGKFCFNNGRANICSADDVAFVDNDIAQLRLTGANLPINWLQVYVPEPMSMNGLWGFDFAAKNIVSEVELNAQVFARDLDLAWTDFSVAVQQLSADINWLGKQAELNWNFQTARVGNSRGKLALTDKQVLSGGLEISDLALEGLSEWLFPEPSDGIAGRLNANFTVSGSLRDPLIVGQATIKNGVLNLAQLPEPVNNINLTLNSNGYRVDTKGDFKTLAGNGAVAGSFEWQQNTWLGQLELQADRLRFEPERDIILTLVPDIKLNLEPDYVSLTGKVGIPSARITLKRLPEQAVGVSADAVVVADDTDVTEQSPRPIRSSLNILLGDDVQFDGFGLETKIRGGMRLQQTDNQLLRADGKLQLVEGRYKAYGQNLKINNGDLIFVDDIENPQLRLEAVRDSVTTNNVTVGLRASGAAKSPTIRLYSQPEMADQARLSYLLTGNPPGTETNTDPTAIAAEAALAFAIESSATQGITNRAAETLGIKNLKIATNTDEAGTQVGVSGYLTPNLLVRYGVGVFDAANSLTLRYQLGKNVVLETVNTENNSAVDILWSFDKE